MLMMRGVGRVRAEVDGVVGLVARIVWPPASVLVFLSSLPRIFAHRWSVH